MYKMLNRTMFYQVGTYYLHTSVFAFNKMKFCAVYLNGTDSKQLICGDKCGAVSYGGICVVQCTTGENQVKL